MTDELKPVRCGCGGEAILKHYCYSYGDDDQYYYVWCSKCDIQTKTYPTEAEAVQAWNRAMGITHERAVEYLQSTGWMQDHDRQMMTMGSIEKSSTVERTAKVETVEKPNVYKCSECGQYFHSTAWGSPVEYCSRCGCRLDWNEDIPMEYFESGGI